jgi:hypothetical protein
MDADSFNVEESYNKKGLKTVHDITSAEKGEHVTTVGACSAEDRFLPQAVILKGAYKKKYRGFGYLPDVKFTCTHRRPK